MINSCEVDDKLILENGYLRLEVDLKNRYICGLRGDFDGRGGYGPNVFSEKSAVHSGLRLQIVDEYGHHQNPVSGSTLASYEIIAKNQTFVIVKLSDMKIQGATSGVSTDWIITLTRDSRKITLETVTSVEETSKLKAIKISAYLEQWFLNGLFQKGNVQYVQGEWLSFATRDKLSAFYTMDNKHGSLAIVPLDETRTDEIALITDCNAFKTGIEFILAGSFPEKDIWSRLNWQNAEDLIIHVGKQYRLKLDLYVNNDSFPVHTLNRNMNIDPLNHKALYKAIYGSAAGCLGSYHISGSAYPTLAAPMRAYKEMHTFFDPDSWSTVAVLSYSGDRYLQNEAKKVLELAQRNMRNDGQIPHHFISGLPEYVAISGTPQTGPNIFWILAVVEYATGTGDTEWLEEHYSEVKKAASWLMRFYDPDRKLFKVNGPLWMDTFKRTNYTFDTNAMMVRLLESMISISAYFGDLEAVTGYQMMCQELKQGIMALWDGKDHFVTYRSEDWITVKDMVDAENYMAIAFGILTDPKKIKAVFKRLDNEKRTHPGGKGTWVSEKYYDRDDCVSENIGDSACALARLWWADELARYAVEDGEAFNATFSNIRQDLLTHTWLTERYNTDGTMIRAAFYHEYPEILSMLIREQIYGIQIKLDKVIIKPMGEERFDYSIGDLLVSYRKQKVTLSIPGKGMRIFYIYGLYANKEYEVDTLGSIHSDRNGVIQFIASLGTVIHAELAEEPV